MAVRPRKRHCAETRVARRDPREATIAASAYRAKDGGLPETAGEERQKRAADGSFSLGTTDSFQLVMLDEIMHLRRISSNASRTCCLI